MRLNRSSKRRLGLHKNKMIKKNIINSYNIHMKCMYIGIVFFILGFKFPKLFAFTVLFELVGLAFMFKNWKIINTEYEQNKKVHKK